MPSTLLHDDQEVFTHSKFGIMPKAMNAINPIHCKLQYRCYKLLTFLIGLPLSKA